MSLGEKHVLTAALSTLIVVGSAVWWGRAPRAPAAPHTENRQAGRTDAASTTLAPAPAASPSLKLPRRLPLQREQEEQRDELRRSIYAALNQPRRAPRAQRSAPERPAAGAGAAPGSGVRAECRSRRALPARRQCYGSLLKASPTASGKVVFAFTNRRDASVGGIVESVELIEGTTLGDPEFDLCVRESLLSLRLKPPKNGGVVTVTYPIDFSPEPAPKQPAGGRGGAAAK